MGQRNRNVGHLKPAKDNNNRMSVNNGTTARRFHGKPLRQPTYSMKDVPWASKDLKGSSLSVVTERQHLVDSIAEITLLCNEATRRQKQNGTSTVAKKTTKPLSIEYIFDRIDTDDPILGFMVRTDQPMSFKGRPSTAKNSPNWKRGMLQGFITMTTFTNWQTSFRFDSLHEMAFAHDDKDLEFQMDNGMRKVDEDGSLADELEATVKGGNPHVEGIVYPRIAELSLFGGLGCGKVRRVCCAIHLHFYLDGRGDADVCSACLVFRAKSLYYLSRHSNY